MMVDDERESSSKDPLDPVEARLRAEVERAVAPYVGVASPAVLAKLREQAERYYREHPQAAQILRAVHREPPMRSGAEAIDGEGAGAGEDREDGEAVAGAAGIAAAGRGKKGA